MKRMRRLALMLLCVVLTGCVSLAPFDPETAGVVDVIVESGGNRDYYAINAHGRVQETEPFEGDDIDIYEVDGDCLETYKGIDNRGRGEFISRLTDIRLWDEEGCAVQNTRVLNEVLLAASELEHDLFDARILRAGEEYFLYVELNVNWVSPCDLYWYDQTRGGLVELHSFDGQEVVGLRVRDLSRLSSRAIYLPDRAGWTQNPLQSWCGQYSLNLTEDGVNLVGTDGIIARKVTGYWHIGWSSGSGVGFASADGYHVIDTDTGSITAYASLSEMPERFAEYFADEGFHTMNGFRFAYGDGNPQAARAALRARFEENRALCDAAAAALYRHPELFAHLRGSAGIPVDTAAGRIYYSFGRSGDERIHLNGSTTMLQYVLGGGFLTAEEGEGLQAMADAMSPRNIGSENGAVFLHFAVKDDSGKTTPTRLYYAPDAASAEACAVGWITWESLGGGWYMGALDNGLH